MNKDNDKEKLESPDIHIVSTKDVVAYATLYQKDFEEYKEKKQV